MNPLVSVVIPTYNRTELLRRCLDALAAQKMHPKGFEVIVADDGVSAQTKQLADSFSSKYPEHTFSYIPVTESRGPAAARNKGWKAAKGRIIAFTDDDCIPAPGWLLHGILAFKNGAAGVSGRIIVPLPGKPSDYHLNASRLEEAEFATANCFYRRDVLAAVGGFDERFTAAWREDADLFFTLHELNYPLLFSKDAIVVHPVRDAKWGISIMEQAKSFYNALLYKKHPALYRQRIQRFAPYSYYGSVAAFLLFIASLALRKRRAAAAAASAWALMTASFCRLRLAGASRSPSHVLEMAVTSAVIPFLSVYWRLRGALKHRIMFF